MMKVCPYCHQASQNHRFAAIRLDNSWLVTHVWVRWSPAIALKWSNWTTIACAGTSSMEAKTILGWHFTGLLEHRT